MPRDHRAAPTLPSIPYTERRSALAASSTAPLQGTHAIRSRDARRASRPRPTWTMTTITGVLETCLYASDLAAAERFYGGALGLQVFAREEGRHVFFR